METQEFNGKRTALKTFGYGKTKSQNTVTVKDLCTYDLKKKKKIIFDKTDLSQLLRTKIEI
jgi:hypothetical protein